MDPIRNPSIAEVVALSHADAVSLYEAIVPIAALLRARIVASGELASPIDQRERLATIAERVDAIASRTATDVETYDDVELVVQRVNRSGRVVFETPRGIASAVPTNATRDRFKRLKPGQRVRVRHAEIARLPNSGGRQVLRAVELR